MVLNFSAREVPKTPTVRLRPNQISIILFFSSFFRFPTYPVLVVFLFPVLPGAAVSFLFLAGFLLLLRARFRLF